MLKTVIGHVMNLVARSRSRSRVRVDPEFHAHVHAHSQPDSAGQNNPSGTRIEV